MIRESIFPVAVLWSGIGISGAEFRNLGFDEAEATNLLGMSFVGFTETLLPGWTLSYGTESQSTIWANQTLLPTVATLSDGTAWPGREGRFAVSLFRDTTNALQWSVSQIGVVPLGTRFLSYRTEGTALELRINGNAIPAMNRPDPHGYSGLTNLVYDMAGFAGDQVSLEFVGPVGPLDAFGRRSVRDRSSDVERDPGWGQGSFEVVGINTRFRT